MDDIVKNSILVVDDEKANLVFLTRVLGEKYAIYTAKDGASGIRKAAELVPDLIMLDILMPDMSGYDVLNELKKQDATRDIPVIFITAMSSDDEEEKALSYNAVDYINKPFKPNVVKLRVRNQIRIVNQVRTIERLSMTDQLTEIPNRRSFDSRLTMEWRRAIREKKYISLLMLDVDKFKAYNDTYGHQQGDNVLRAVAKSLEQDMMRPGDFAARWGGEEFAAVLACTDLNGAMQVAERIRANIEALRITVPGTSDVAPVTISIGVESMMPDQNSSLDLFISAADNALYAAKKAGRNRVCGAGK
ncbi:MAG: diguanylate cyclase [Chitinispirillia bacterium]|nr:diguanylate cyclase [Chitinispirillia bacterium]MCL2242602.1 diguanylate cyclase [Chitinispirillia bacterium]